MSRFGLLLVFCGLVAAAAAAADQSGDLWAFLVASSEGYSNYRHQADLCHAYQVLHENGISDDHIIVMMVDDIAYNEENPTPGVIVNSNGGHNVYKGVPKDYTGKNVTPQVFLDVLQGNKTGVKGIGSERVIESGPNDRIFLNFVDHGGIGMLFFPSETLPADEFIHVLEKMAADSKFAKMVLYIEACHAGSMFDDLLPEDLNIFAMTAADPHESSFACCYDEKRSTYVGDLFSVMWLNVSEHEYLKKTSLHHQFEKVRTRTNQSHVEEYGDLDVGADKVSEFQGFHETVPKQGLNFEPKDVIDSMDVPLYLLDKKIAKEKRPELRENLQAQRKVLLKKRDTVDAILNKIISKVAPTPDKKFEIKVLRHRLRKSVYPCYKEAFRAFSSKCFHLPSNLYVRKHLHSLVNMCSVSWLSTQKVITAISETCANSELFYNLAVV